MAIKDIDLLRWWVPQEFNKYPHYNTEDAKVWSLFLKSYASNYSRFSYDVPLRNKYQADATPDLKLQDNWDYLTSFKIDALGTNLVDCEIIEVKPMLSFQAIGQVESYYELFRDNYITHLRLLKHIVCLSGSLMHLDICKGLGIKVTLVG